VEELAERIPVYGVDYKEKVRKGNLKPFREIYWFEKKVFDKKGIEDILEKKIFILPYNIASSFADNYRE
jgi:hypothetical protein